MSSRVAIIIYTMHGHIGKLAEAVQKGVVSAGGDAEILQVPETLSPQVLAKIHAPAKPNYPFVQVSDLPKYDAFLFGIPTRFGGMSGQWKTFWDATGGLWGQGALAGKYASFFVSTSSPGGGQEETILTSISTLTHHGIIFVPFGYSNAFPQLTNMTELRGAMFGHIFRLPARLGAYIHSAFSGSPWGAGTFTGTDDSRQPSDLEKEIAEIQGSSFWNIISRVKFQEKP